MARRRRKSAKQGNGSRSKFKLDLSWIKMPDMHVVKRTCVGLLWLGSVAAVSAGWIIGVPQLQAFASQHGSVDRAEISIRFINPPAWFNGDLAETLFHTARMQIEGDPMRRDDLVAVRQSLLDTGWFDSIRQVRRVRENLIEIDAQFVRPYAVIRDAEGDHLVDAAAKLLPLKYEHGAKTNFVAITGAHFARPQRPGQPWVGMDILAGLKVLQTIEREPWRSQIREIDVTECQRGGPIKLRTDAGCTIVWGGPPGEEPALEVLAAEKIHRLNFLFERYGRVDRNFPGELDITDQRGVMAR